MSSKKHRSNKERYYSSSSKSSSSSSSSSSSRNKHEDKKRHRRKDDDRSDFRSRSTSPRQNEDTNKGGLSKKIQGFNEMTPAERVRAKMKILLDNAGTSDKQDCSNSSTKSVRPSEIDIISIDSDAFLPQNFHSTRTPNKEQTPSSVSGSHHDNIIFGTTTGNTGNTGNTDSVHTASLVKHDYSDQEVTVKLGDGDLKLKWIKKLTQLRNNYT